MARPHLVADEHHEKLNGEKVQNCGSHCSLIATTVGAGCVLGAEISASSSGDGLQKAYGVFKDEALEVVPKYVPETVNTDGWSGMGGVVSCDCFDSMFPSCVAVDS